MYRKPVFETSLKKVSKIVPLRSEAVQIILSRKPGFIERWALLIFLAILLLLLAGTWFIKYPDVVVASATLIPVTTPKEIVSITSGKIEKIFVHNEDLVLQNSMIAWLETTGDHNQAIALGNLIDSGISLMHKGNYEKIFPFFEESFDNLGELQTPYQQLFTSWQKFNDYLVKVHYYKKKQVLKQESFFSKKIIFNIKPQQPVVKEYQQTEDKIQNLKQNISKQKNVFEQVLQRMKSITDNWLKKYIIKAPADGIVIFVNPLQENQFIQSNKVLGFVNANNASCYARAILPQSSFGKIDTGQLVQLRFEAYPYQKFGYVSGKLRHISKVPVGGGFPVNIELVKGLSTNNKKDIPFKNGLRAQAIIITNESRLFQRFYNTIVNGINR